eukprot:scaffold8959_cov55-Phaeocystis_antarctica.AAC.3
MEGMFKVRSSPCPAPNLQPCPLLHAACAAVVHRPLPPDPYTSPRTACPSFDSRQYAYAFNQPLSFDASSVTTMYSMFLVRSSPCPAPNLQPRPLLCTLRAPRSPDCPPTRIPRPAPHALSYRLSAGRVRVQSAAELRHVQRHSIY